MSEPADLEGGLVAYLRGHAATNAVAGGRIFGGELHPDETAQMPRNAIVIRASGGVPLLGGTYVDHDTQRVDLFAFGKTPKAAGDVMRTAALALRDLRKSVHAGCLIHWANAASGSLAGREPVTEWPRQFQSFQVMHGLLKIEE